MIMGTPGRKFEIIRDITEDPENVLNIKDLCDIAGVSRSGYYNWIASETKRQEKEEQEEPSWIKKWNQLWKSLHP